MGANDLEPNELAVAREFIKIKSERLTTKMELSWKEGRLVAASYKDLPFLK